MTDELLLDGITEQALAYARSGIAVFPVHCDTKAPMPGYGWAVLASNNTTDVTIDFTNAIMLWGHSNVSIAWALGNDGCMAVDLDHKPEPDWVSQIEPYAAINPTKRGRHLYFRNPEGLVPGNGTSHFPTKGWGDVRGAGGYVVIAGPDRPGLAMEQFERIQPYPIPDHLTPYGGYTTAATTQEVKDFNAVHKASKGDQYLNWLRTAIETQWQPGSEGDPRSGRHPLACEWLAKVADESQLGIYPFRDGVLLVRDWWRKVTPPERHGREWNGMLSWAVGRALSKQVAPPAGSESTGSESPGPADDDGITQPGDQIAFVDWHEFFTKERTDPEWLVQDLWPFGRHLSIGSRAGQGKSELIQYVVSCLALGIDPWTRQPRQPRRVIYLDMEMTDEDLYDRMTDFGYTDEHAELLQANLLYAVLPVIPALNSLAGVGVVERLVDRHEPDVFVLDTFMKTLQGDENDAVTVQEFTRLTGMLLKSRRVQSCRADHYGKSPEQGNRGTSAKDDDVDVAWHLTRSGRYTTKLHATKRRQGFVPETLWYERWHTTDDGVRFTPRDAVIDNIPNPAVHEAMMALDLAGVPVDYGRDRARRALLDAGNLSWGNDVLTEAIRLRKLSCPDLSSKSQDSSEQA